MSSRAPVDRILHALTVPIWAVHRRVVIEEQSKATHPETLLDRIRELLA